MNKLNILELEKEYVDKGTAILKYVCPSHNKETVKIHGGDEWITVEFLETDITQESKFSYTVNSQIKSVNCKFVDGVLTIKIQFKVPEQRKLNVVFD